MTAAELSWTMLDLYWSWLHLVAGMSNWWCAMARITSSAQPGRESEKERMMFGEIKDWGVGTHGKNPCSFEGRDSLVNLVIFSTHSNVFHCSSSFRIVFQVDYHEPSTQYPLLQKSKANFQTRKALNCSERSWSSNVFKCSMNLWVFFRVSLFQQDITDISMTFCFQLYLSLMHIEDFLLQFNYKMLHSPRLSSIDPSGRSRT